MNSLKSNLPLQAAFLVRTQVTVAKPAAREQQGVRCAVRFPLSLSVVLGEGSEEWPALTRNISANGVLFEMDHELEPGTEIEFSVRMPAAFLGSCHDVLVHCTGRVVRCCLSPNQVLTAATIDDYRFAEQ
jgi:hypothetical protein